MLCQNCHKNLATVRYAEVVDGHVSDKHLCANCLAQQQNNATSGFELPVTASGARRPPAEKVAREAMRQQRACPACGALLSRIMDSGKVGCSRCYSAFGEQVESILEGLQRSLQHRGKRCYHEDNRERLRSDLQNKRSLLRSVLKAERYEEAAQLRDEIQSLETGLTVSESGAD
jgi:protein arginine kinase activator